MFLKKYNFPIIVVLLSKLYILLGIFLISQIISNSRTIDLSIFTSWNIWDSPHYLSIALNGYQTQGDETNYIAFLPLFPFLVFVMHIITFTNFLTAGFLINAIFSILLGCVLYYFVKSHSNKITAQLSVLSLFIFPTSFFLHIPYSESLFLFLVLVAFIALDKKYYWLACIISGLATLTRLQGLALAAAIIFELVYLHKNYLKENFLRAFLMITLPISGFIIYLAINYFEFGNIFQFAYVQQKNWNNTFDIGGHGLFSAIESITWRQGADKYMLGWAQIIAFIVAVASTFYSLLKLKPSYTIYCLVITFMMFTSSFWLSNPRYILVLFPIFIFLGELLKNKYFFFLWVVLSISLLTIFSVNAIEYGPVF